MGTIGEELKNLADLLEKGLITREQFDQQRDEMLRAGGGETMPSQIGSYTVTGEIGQGGMGRVLRGRHRMDEFASRQGGEVAIKMLHPQYASRPDIVERFEREAALGIKLNHPGIVRVFELIIDSGRVALIMELVEGRPMSEMIGNETGPIPWTRSEPMFVQLLEALTYAHANGVVHRDLKPENVMVGPQGDLKVLDFGIAKDMESGRTKTGTGMGTVDYMAPEQYTDAKTVDQRADIYALGMTLYEMLAGRLPWDTDRTSEFEVLKRKETGEVPLPTDYYPDIPPGVVAMVMQMIAADPDARYTSCAAIQAELQGAGPVPSPVPASSKLERSAPVPRSPPPKPSAPEPGASSSRSPLPWVLGLLLVLGISGGLLALKTGLIDLDSSRKSRSDDDDDDDSARSRKSGSSTKTASASGRKTPTASASEVFNATSKVERAQDIGPRPDTGFPNGHDVQADVEFVQEQQRGVMELDLRPQMPSWVIAAGAFKGASGRADAISRAEMLRREGFESHIMYLPDYPVTTSGKDYYVAYVGPWPYSKGASFVRSRLVEVQRVVEGAYGIKIDDFGRRETIE